MNKRISYVLNNDEGMESVQAVGLILIAIIIVAALILFKDKITAFLKKATSNVGTWSSRIKSDVNDELSWSEITKG